MSQTGSSRSSQDELADTLWRTAHADMPPLSEEETRDRNRSKIAQLQNYLNQELFEDAKKLFSHDFVFHDGQQTQEGTGVFVDLYEALTETMPDLVLDFQSVIAQFDRVAVRMVNHGTHLGNYRGIAPPSANPVSFTAVCIFRFNSDGRIAEAWQDADNLALLMQLGVIKMPG